jgi:hypothetical protein
MSTLTSVDLDGLIDHPLGHPGAVVFGLEDFRVTSGWLLSLPGRPVDQEPAAVDLPAMLASFI